MATVKGFGDRVAQERRLKGVREARDLLKKDVAKALSVSESTVGRWESGTVPDDPDTLARLARYFGVTVAWLHYGVEPREAPVVLETSEHFKPVAKSTTARRKKSGG